MCTDYHLVIPFTDSYPREIKTQPTAFVIYCYATQLRLGSWQSMYCLSHSFHESRVWAWLRWSSASVSLTRLPSRCWQGWRSHLRLDWGRNHFWGHMVVGRTWFLESPQLRASVIWWLLDRGCSLFLAMKACPVGSLFHHKQQEGH